MFCLKLAFLSENLEEIVAICRPSFRLLWY